jgi:hypothetical protein
MKHALMAVVFAALLCAPSRALAQNDSADPQAPTTPQTAATQTGTSARPTVAGDYSDAYEVRRRIHVYASLATLPLFATQAVLGQKLYDGGSSGMRDAHTALGIGIGSLFGVNTVTGVWNMWEARKDPNGRNRRLIHGLTMLGADAGFVATGMLAPGDEGGGNRSLHRTVALTSMAVATGSYLFMLFTR